MTAIFAIQIGGQAVTLFAQPVADFTAARRAATPILELLRRTPEIDVFSDEGLKPAEALGDIAVRGVKFAYPSAPSTLVCNGYSLHVAAGTLVALCGPSGSGKSTLIQLIERFYDPQEGTLCFDGAPRCMPSRTHGPSPPARP